jgi:hypothetical protein
MEVFHNFCNDIGINPEVVNETSVNDFEEFLTDIVKILKKDNTFFEVPRLVFGVDLCDYPPENVWKNLLNCIVTSFLQGDVKKKLHKIVPILKSLWQASDTKNEDIDKILNDDKSSSLLQEIIDYITNTRLAKIFIGIIKEFDMTEFDNINVDSFEEVIEMIKNPDNPVVSRIKTKMQYYMNEKVKTGQLSQQIVQQEIESIKSKLMSLFGNSINEFLGGTENQIPTELLMNNSPEGRRQRMLARLQRKMRDKNSM